MQVTSTSFATTVALVDQIKKDVLEKNLERQQEVQSVKTSEVALHPLEAAMVKFLSNGRGATCGISGAANASVAESFSPSAVTCRDPKVVSQRGF